MCLCVRVDVCALTFLKITIFITIKAHACMYFSQSVHAINPTKGPSSKSQSSSCLNFSSCWITWIFDQI